MTPESGEPSAGSAASMAHVVAIVPFYNVGKLLVPVVQGLNQTGCHTIIVDDGSTDYGPGELGKIDYTRLNPMRINHNMGKGHAIRCGLESALRKKDATAFVLLDGDGQHDPSELPRLVAAFEREHADLLIGARDFSGGDVPFRSRFGNVMTAYALRVLLRVKLRDTQSGYRVLSRRFAEAVLREVPGGRYETEMAIVGLAIRGGYKIVSEPIRTIYEPGNRTSHFRKIEDSIRVYWTLLKTAFARRKPTSERPQSPR